MIHRTLATAAAATLLVVATARAGSQIGDAGHFIIGAPAVFANNPKGEAFTVTVHRHIWASHPWGSDGRYKMSVIAPGGKVVAAGTIPSGKPKVTLRAPKGKPGVYEIRYKPGGYGLTWIQCSLDRMVVAAGDWDMKQSYQKTFALHAMAPRRWYFHVPAGVKQFRIKTGGGIAFTSTREDWGYLVMNPRGQRVSAVYGGVPPRAKQRDAVVKNGFVTDERVVYVDQGAAGRFWSIWVTGGDSHSFSDLHILLKGVSPYYAPTPEQWFDPRTGKAPGKIVYDKSQVRALDRASKTDKSGKRISRDFYDSAPSTFLGDEDYTGMRGPHTVYLANPAGRPITFGTCTYVLPIGKRSPVSYSVFGPTGRPVLKTKGSFAWRDSNRIKILAAGKGVYRVDVDCKEWYAWAEPAPQMVLAGKRTAGGGSVFKLQIGIARHWCFKVPKGTRQFELAVTVPDKDHALLAELHAPDRILEILYVRGGNSRRAKVTVPAGFDDKIWFVRTEVGSATRYVSEDVKNPRRVRVDADIELRGVPGYLAPTWEQWFLPVSPPLPAAAKL